MHCYIVGPKMNFCPQCKSLLPQANAPCPRCGNYVKPPPLKWYFKTPFIVFAILSVLVLALPLVWFHPRWSKATKIFVTVLTVIITYATYATSKALFDVFNQYYSQTLASLQS